MSSPTWKSKSAILCGASAGLGKAFAVELANQGIGRLVLIARSRAPLSELQQTLLAMQPTLQVECLTADLRDRAQVERLAEQLEGRFELLIQAVGQSDRGRLSELTDERLRELLDTNVLSSLHALQHLAPRLQQPGGRVILIGSLASKFAPRFLGGYAMAKHALAALAQQARLEFAEQGIQVLLACPGPIARDDAGARYAQLTQASDLPESARQPGGGARVRGLEAGRLVRDILKAASAGQAEIIRPRKARLLYCLAALAPRLGDRLLRKNSS